MKKLIPLLTLCAASVQGQECKLDTAHLVAGYEIQQAEAPARTLSLWRNGDQLVYERKNEQISDLWQRLSNGHVRPIRYFDAYQRGIEYQSGELKGQEPEWQQKYALFSAAQIAAMDETGREGEGCELAVNYRQSKNGKQYSLVWLPAYQLPKSWVVTDQKDGTVLTKWQLGEVSMDRAKLTARFSAWDNYQTTDYADVGDNESDPFLAKMINQGFIKHGASGFYNADGHPIGDGHGH